MEKAKRFRALQVILVEHRRQAIAQLIGKTAFLRSHSRDVTDIAESSEEGIQRDIHCGLSSLYGQRVRNIDNALLRLREGSYGNCDDCGQEIPSKRLEALPFAVRCKNCAEIQEAGGNRGTFIYAAPAAVIPAWDPQ